MLVLTRKKGESIRIGDEIELRVLSIQGNRVRLGIEAPSHVDVRRGELVFEINLEDLPQDARGDASRRELLSLR